MKKFIIAALVLLLVCSTAVFARYGQGSEVDVQDFTGFSMGGSFVKETYDTDAGKFEDRAGQLYFGLSEYAFFGSSSMGLYLDLGLLINVKDSESDNIEKSPVYIDLSLGLGGRLSIDRSTSFLFGVGPEFTYFTNEYTYYGYKIEKTYMSMGVGLDAEVMYKLGKDFYVSVGAKGSVLFLKWMTREVTSGSGYEGSSSTDTEGYFGYRVTPKLTFYYMF